MQQLRNKLAEIFDTHIDDKEDLRPIFQRLDEQGRLDMKKVHLILLAIIDELEK